MSDITAAQRVAERLNELIETNRTIPDGENAYTVAEGLGFDIDHCATERALELFGDCDPVVVGGDLVRYDYGDGRYFVDDWAAIVTEHS